MSDMAPFPTSPAAGTAPVLRVLLVEDDRLAAQVLGEQLETLGYLVETADNGAEAYALLRAAPDRADIVVSDRFMPVLDGLGLTRRLRRERATRHLPIIMLTGTSDAASTAEGLEAGVMQYVAKPVEPALLRQVLDVAARQVAERRQLAAALGAHQAGFANIERIDFHLRRVDEIGPVASLLASLSPHAERILPGLRALLANGVEHGLLRLGGAARQAHLAQGTLAQELARRAADPAYDGFVEAAAQRLPEGLRYAVRDPGPGFAWRRFLTPDASRSAVDAARGITVARVAFTTLEYHGTGNLVTAIIANETQRLW